MNFNLNFVLICILEFKVFRRECAGFAIFVNSATESSGKVILWLSNWEFNRGEFLFDFLCCTMQFEPRKTVIVIFFFGVQNLHFLCPKGRLRATENKLVFDFVPAPTCIYLCRDHLFSERCPKASFQK